MNNIRLRRLALVLVLVLVGIEFVRNNIGTFSVVDGVSMYPTFLPNDMVQARTLTTGVQRGDVMIIIDDRGDQVIKRIIGLPGETVTLYRGFVYINRQRLREPYLPKHTYTFNSNQEDESPVTWRLTDAEYFVLGDNRLHSSDSRHHGPVQRSQLDRAVSIPENSARPEFCDVMLAESGKVLPGKSRFNSTRQHADIHP